MKAKVDKTTNLDKKIVKVDQKVPPKVLSPKHTQSKNLEPIKKIQKDSKKISEIHQVKQKVDLDLSLNISALDNSVQSQQSTKSLTQTLKSLKEATPIFDLKKLESPKNSMQLLSKPSLTGKFTRSKNPTQKQQESKIKKILQEKDQKIQQIQKLNEQLQIKIQLLNKQRQKTLQIIQQYKNQKEALEKNLQKYRNVAQQNKKLLRQKAQGYNSNSHQIRSLKQQLQQFKNNKKITKTSEIGINTQQIASILTDYQEQSKITNETSTNTQKSQLDLITHYNQETYQYYISLLNQLTIKDNIKLSIIKNFYTSILYQKNIKLKQQEQLIYMQQIQLNQLYEYKYNKDRAKANINTDMAILIEINHSQNLKSQLYEQEKKLNILGQQLWNRQRQNQILTQDLKIKNLYFKEDLNISFDDIRNNSDDKLQIQNIKRQLQKTQRVLQQKEQQIRQLQNKNTQKQKIIKSLSGKKPKIIIK